MAHASEFWDALARDMPGKAASMVEGGYVDPETRDASGTSALFAACARGYADVVAALLKHGAAPDARTPDDQGPLFAACVGAGKASVVKSLLERGVSPSARYCGTERVPAIVAAASRGNLAAVHALLDAGAALEESDAQGHTALHTACFTGSASVALYLIEQGAAVSVRSLKGVLPLAWAAAKGHTAVVKALLDRGANVDGVGGTGAVVARSEIDLIPLHAAARANRLDVLKLLLDRGANMEQRAAYAKGVRALHVAAMADAKAACLELLRRGADFGAVDDEFKTVVELASLSGAVSTLELLVSWEQHGGEAPPDEKPVEEPVKWTPDLSKVDPVYFKLASWMGEGQALVTAATKNEYSVCRSLLEQGADPNCSMKMSPLAAACKEGHARIVRLLLMSGADWSRVSSQKTPLEWAREEALRDPYEDELSAEANRVLAQAAARDAAAPAPVQVAAPRESRQERQQRFAETLALMEQPHVCGMCGKQFEAAQLKRCGQCKLVRYCGAECQRLGWKRFHKAQCNTWAERKNMLLHRDSPKQEQAPVLTSSSNE